MKFVEWHINRLTVNCGCRGEDHPANAMRQQYGTAFSISFSIEVAISRDTEIWFLTTN
jgi:hypothetical protein